MKRSRVQILLTFEALKRIVGHSYYGLLGFTLSCYVLSSASH